MEELVHYLVTLLVDEPEAIEIRSKLAGTITVYQVSVAPSDLGKVIGRHGRTANALRTVVEAAAHKQQQKATVDIVS